MNDSHDQAKARPAKQVMVCIVDDDADVLRSLRFLLEMDRFDVHTFSSAELLLDFDGCDGFDCFILDYKMKPMDGFELTKRLRGLGIEAPVIIVTGFPDGNIQRKANALGISAVLVKPHLEENIAASVHAALKLRPR